MSVPSVIGGLHVDYGPRVVSRPRQGYVYLIEGWGVLKIGYSTDPAARLRSLQSATPTPLKLVAQREGTMAQEKALHRRFQSLRIAGEWFADVPAIREVFAP